MIILQYVALSNGIGHAYRDCDGNYQYHDGERFRNGFNVQGWHFYVFLFIEKSNAHNLELQGTQIYSLTLDNCKFYEDDADAILV